jgi:beta-phosphoglucomutase
MSEPAAVVFDFDGVLADTEGLHLAALQDVFAPRGWTLDRDTYFDRYLGYDDRDLVRAFARHAGLTLAATDINDVLSEKARAYAHRLSTGAVLFPTAPGAIARLGARYRLGIASGSLRDEITAILAGNALLDAIAAIVGADDVERSKPAPDSYAAAVTKLGVAPARAVAIEDSQWGLASARAAGLRTIGITTSYPAHVLNGADHVVHSLDDVTIDLVDSLVDMR